MISQMEHATEPFIMHGHIQDVAKMAWQTQHRLLKLPVDTSSCSCQIYLKQKGYMTTNELNAIFFGRWHNFALLANEPVLKYPGFPFM